MKLTRGERLWLWRKRAGMTSQEVADIHGVGHDIYTDWEWGRRMHDCPLVMTGRPDGGERLTLLRRRAGWTLEETSRRMGVARSTYCGWEVKKGNFQRGLEWWETIGRIG